MEVTSGCEAGDCAAHERRQTKQCPMDGHVRCCRSRFDRPSLLLGPGKLTFGSNFRSRGLGACFGPFVQQARGLHQQVGDGDIDLVFHVDVER